MIEYFFVLFLLAIVLSVFLRFTASDYPFGIFKLFSADICSPKPQRLYFYLILLLWIGTTTKNLFSFKSAKGCKDSIYCWRLYRYSCDIFVWSSKHGLPSFDIWLRSWPTNFLVIWSLMSSWEENYDWIQDIYRAINPGLPEITLRQYKVSVSWRLIMTPELKKIGSGWECFVSGQ